MLQQHVGFTNWNNRVKRVDFGCFTKEDKVTVYGSKGKMF
jgi:hypothetical protein